MKKLLAISVSAAMSSPKLLGPFFGGESWATGRAVIKAMFAEKMSEAEIASFREVAERDPPKQRVAEATIIALPGGVRKTIWLTQPFTLETSSATIRCRREENIGPCCGSTYLKAPPPPPLSGTFIKPNSLTSREIVACVAS